MKKLKFKNKFEAKVYRQLRRVKTCSVGYETEKLAYVLARHYIPDFIIDTPLGKVYIECKGYLRPEDKAKLLAVKKYHPNVDLRILFYASNKKYIKWAEKNRIPYAIDKVPKEWLKGLF